MFISLLGVKSMNNMEKTKYKSWGSLKKQMNDLQTAVAAKKHPCYNETPTESRGS